MANPDAEITAARCAHVECRCVVNPAQAIRVGADYYCSEACVQGKGCAHEGCECGRSTAIAGA